MLQAATSLCSGRIKVSSSAVIEEFIEGIAWNHNALRTKLQVRNFTSFHAPVNELSRNARAFRSFINGVVGR